MKILAIIVALVLLIFLGVAVFFKIKTKPPPDKHDLVGSLDAQINKMFKDRDKQALVVGVYKDGRFHIKGYGVTSRESDSVPDAQTVFEIGSITKIFTASLLQVLSDKGVVSLDSTLNELIGDDTALSEQVANINLKQLATHTSGLPRLPKSMLTKVEELAGKDNVLDDPYSYLGPEYMFDYLKSAPDAKASGKFAYSNFGVGLLGHVLEKVTNETYENLLVKEIFAPLGMQSTGITVTPEAEQHFAHGHDAKGDATGRWTSKALGAAGAVNSNMTDMLTFVQASLTSGTAANLRFEKMRVPLYKGKTGLGWLQPGFFEKLFGSRNSVWHNGTTGGFSSYISIDPIDNSGLVILSNRAMDVGIYGLMLNREIRTQSWAD